MSGVERSARGAGPLAMLFLVFPAVVLPLDLLHAAPGIMTYAVPAQAARIFLWAVGLSLVLSLVACAVCAPAAPTAKGRFAARWLCLAIAASAVLYGILRWSAFFIPFPEESEWLRQCIALALAVVAGFLLARRMREEQLQALASVMRAAGVLVAAGVAAAAAVLALDTVPAPARASAIDAQAARDRPAIFLVTIDTLSARHLPMYGYGRPTAPRLAEFAAEATVFLRHYASSNFTTSTVTSMMYGTRPWTDRAIQHEGLPLRHLAAQSLPAALRRAGYFTASVATNPWAAPANLGLGEHFDVLSEHNVCAMNDPLWVLRPDLQVAIKSSSLWSGLRAFFVRASDALGLCGSAHFDPELAFAEARRILAEAPPQRPLFLWVHLFPPHDPYVAPEPFLGRFAPVPEGRDRTSTIPPYLYAARHRFDFPGLWELRYDEAIRYVDHHVGAFFDALRKSGRYDRSLIIVTADHGESFSKGYGGHGGPGLHEDLVHIPLIVKLPGQRRPARIAELSEQVDLAPTILELAGIPPSGRAEGVSLVPAMRGQVLDRPVFTMNFQQNRRLAALDTGVVAMIRGRWKYVHYLGHIGYPQMPKPQDGLYDLLRDPAETRDESAARAGLAAEMRAEIEAKLAQHGQPIE